MDDTTDTSVDTPIQDELLSVDGDSTDDAKASGDEVRSLTAVESSIKMNMARIARAQEDLKPLKEMLKSFLEGDEQYVQATEAAKKASQLKTGRKRELMATENGKELEGKMNSLKEDLKEAQEALSYYLREYQRLTGLNEFEGEDGELRQIVYVAKLVRKTSLNK